MPNSDQIVPVECSVDQQIQTIINDHVIYTTTDLKGIIEEVSPAFCERSGYRKEELIGRSHSFLRAPDTNDTLYDDLWTTIENDKIWSGEIKNIAKDGQPYWIKCKIRPLFCNSGNKIGYIAMRDNITREKEIEEYALVDEVTKIYNRRKINQDVSIALERYKRYSTPFSLVLIDIDYFKTFNDRYGHLIGDKVLIQISAFINTQTRQSDIFARWGGDEFALLITNSHSHQAAILCEKLRRTVAEKVCSTLQAQFDITEYISCSFGVTSIETDDTLDTLLDRTDRALYLAKERGRNRVEFL
ncbi:MAG: diguanylate cyclase [Helicobacteraceae bacterium]|jgi:diguanylate cyclase (GGDEF)-like protein/PAS domain S-box-containing protein|nr:diguanylate cyclase [Helicobacteraceae bacterium]